MVYGSGLEQKIDWSDHLSIQLIGCGAGSRSAGPGVSTQAVIVEGLPAIRPIDLRGRLDTRTKQMLFISPDRQQTE